VLQQGAWTQLMLGAATAFPASPNTSDTCFRSDLGAWFRYDGAAWQQMGAATFTTAARPAAPPTGYRYFDMTANAVYRWTGSAYVIDPLPQPAWIAAPTLLNGFTASAAIQYRLDESANRVVWRGGANMVAGSVNAVIFNIPVGYRPSYTGSNSQYFPVTVLTSSAWTVGLALIATNGDLSIFCGAGTTFVGLDGLSYPIT
jgi:hypothetical protein